LIKGDDASAEAHRKFYDEYNAVLDMDADYYLETIQTVFQDFKLVNGTWDVKGVDGKVERVRPQDIRGTALMTVEGELDDISGSGQTRAAQDLCSGVPASERKHLEVEGAGHYGIFSGRRWRDMVYPQLVKFILNHAPKTASKAPAIVQPKADVKTTAKTATKTVTKPVAKAAAKTGNPTRVQASVKGAAKPKATVKSVAVAKPKASVKTTWVQPAKKA
jgi:poly(3-hydroxybutyrate) depolymerase